MMRVADLAPYLATLAEQAAGARIIVGLVGPPGVGKSTVTEAALSTLGPTAALLPMDGYHLSNEVLRAHGTIDRKGAPETFDAGGFVATLARLRADDNTTVYAPRFHREIEESIAAEIAIEPTHRIVLTEGNYLLTDIGVWGAVRALLDTALFLRLDDATRHERLIARHEQYGRSREAAIEWALGSDERNAQLVAASAARADDFIDLD